MNDLIPAADRDVERSDNSLVDETALIGDTTEMRALAEALAENSTRAVCNSQETAQGCTLLVGKIREHLKAIDEAREERKKPYLEAGRAIDGHYNSIAALLVTRDKSRVVGGPLARVLGMLDSYRREQERLQELERQRLEEEARKERERAEAAERARQEAEQFGTDEEARDAAVTAIGADMAAERLERQAEAVAAPQPIVTAYGARAGRRAVYTAVVDDWKKAVAHAYRVNPQAIKDAVQQVLNAQVRAGVRQFPAGMRIVEDSATVVRTR